MDSLETSPPTAMDAMKGRPVLLASVIVMGVLLVIGFMAVFSTIVYRVVSSSDPIETSVQGQVGVRGQFGTINVPVADGTSLLGTTFVDDRLSIVTSSNGIAEVIIMDTKRGIELGRVRLVPHLAGADGNDVPTDSGPNPGL